MINPAPTTVGWCRRRHQTMYGIVSHGHFVPVQLASRICAAWIVDVARGGIHGVSVYLYDTEGVSDRNLALLQQLAAALRTLRMPWIIGGDWNMTPQQLAATGVLDVLNTQVPAPILPTRHSSVYD